MKIKQKIARSVARWAGLMVVHPNTVSAGLKLAKEENKKASDRDLNNEPTLAAFADGRASGLLEMIRRIKEENP